MKITSTSKPTPNSDLLPKKPLTRKKYSKITPRLSRNPKFGVGSGGPPTPRLRWNSRWSAQTNAGDGGGVEEDKSPESGWKLRGDKCGTFLSTRKLGAALWRIQVATEGEEENEEMQRRRRRGKREDNGEGGDRVGFKPGIDHGGEQLCCLHGGRECGGIEAKDPLRSPCSVNGPVNGYHCERQSPFQYANYAMEGATKWDPIGLKTPDDDPDDTKSLDQKANATVISALKTEIEQARAHVEELEIERRSAKKKVEHFLEKLSEERSTWRSREHEKVRAIINDIKDDLSRERKKRQRLEIVDSKLVNELAEVKLTAKRYVQDYEKERKARELIEEVYDELAKEIWEDKAEVDSLKKECMKIREEVDDERKMLQMAEVWREERVQMKLVDAKASLDQKYSQMNYLVEELEKFLNLKGLSLDAMS